MKQFTTPTLVLTALLAMGFSAGSAMSHETGRQGPFATMPMHGMGMGDAHGSEHGQGYMHGADMMGGPGMMGHPGMMENMFGSFDENNDGRMSPGEMRKGFAARMKEFDSNGDGSMTLEEFEAFHAAMIRNMVVDHFQALDEDGDGRITGAEMSAPADRMERLQNMQQRWRDNHMQGGQQRGMENGRMMNDD
ncbi:calcium-binding protein [uncultured Roseovarius sp.]|uniref:EF-hand domain-containing protein n=1 Tax=uncultured Roseovarius sp. TaxID=293344 RepID=UPI00262AAA25|nr:calcium-binding protein [uncultured Roseovarius sp.]